MGDPTLLFEQPDIPGGGRGPGGSATLKQFIYSTFINFQLFLFLPTRENSVSLPVVSSGVATLNSSEEIIFISNDRNRSGDFLTLSEQSQTKITSTFVVLNVRFTSGFCCQTDNIKLFYSF